MYKCNWLASVEEGSFVVVDFDLTVLKAIKLSVGKIAVNADDVALPVFVRDLYNPKSLSSSKVYIDTLGDVRKGWWNRTQLHPDQNNLSS